MSRGINKVILLGNATSDPDVRHTQSGTVIATLRIATNESWRDKQTGELQERAEFHRVKFFGRLGEIVGEYVRKGQQLYVEGSLRTEKYTDREGIERYSTDVIATEMQMVGGSRSAGGSRDEQREQHPAPARSQRAPQARSTQRAPAMEASAPADDWDDEVPF